MVATESPTFSCDECGKVYRWKQQLAGRKVRCKCGELMLVDEPPRGIIAEGLAAMSNAHAADEEADATEQRTSTGFMHLLTWWWR